MKQLRCYTVYSSEDRTDVEGEVKNQLLHQCGSIKIRMGFTHCYSLFFNNFLYKVGPHNFFIKLTVSYAIIAKLIKYTRSLATESSRANRGQIFEIPRSLWWGKAIMCVIAPFIQPLLQKHL